MKKLIVSIMLCLSLFSGGTASAFVPLVVPVIAIGAGALIATALNFSVLYGMLPKSGDSHITDANGNVYRKSEAVYVDLTKDAYPVPVEKHVPVKAKITASQIKQLAAKNPVNYSSVNAAVNLHPVPLKTGGSLNVGTMLSSRVLSNGLGSGGPWVTSDYWSTGDYNGTPCAVWHEGNSSSTTYLEEKYSLTLPPTSSEALKKMTGSTSGGPIIADSSYQDEIDRMLQDPDYVPVFTDDGGLPYYPPAGLPSQAQLQAAVDAYNKHQALLTSKSDVVNAQAAAVSSAQTAAVAAHAAAQQSAAAAAASPGDAGLQSAAARDAAAAAAADAALAAAQAEQVKQNDAFANLSSATSKPMPDLGEPAKLKSIDLAPVARLKGALANTFLGKLATGMGSYIEPLMEEPQAPDFDIPIGKNVIHFDLSCFDSVAVVTRFTSSLLLIVGAAYGVIRFWRGVS